MDILRIVFIILLISLLNGEEAETIKNVKGKQKSEKLAFMMSLILPGLGEYYAKGGWIRTSIPFITELASYVTIFAIKNKAKNLENDYKYFADAHYSHDRYEKWRDFIENAPDTLIRRDIIFTFEPDTVSHMKSTIVDFYEMIGRYDEFVQGWDDANPDMVSNNFEYIWKQNFETDYDAGPIPKNLII